LPRHYRQHVQFPQNNKFLLRRWRVGDKATLATYPDLSVNPRQRTDCRDIVEVQVPSVAALTAKGYAVAGIDYRLNQDPVAAVQDAKAAVRFLRANAARYHLNPDRFAAWGNSAGGYSAIMLGLTADQHTVFDDPNLGNLDFTLRLTDAPVGSLAWDVIGVEQSVNRMREEGRAIPANVEKMLAAGARSFYKTENGARHYFDFVSGEYKPIRQPAGLTVLKSLKDQNKVIKKNVGASLIDLGDGVACVEFHAKMNALGQDQIGMIQFAIKEIEKNFAGLVIGNQGENFSAGANIMMILLAAQEGEWDELAMAVKQFQNTTMSLRYSAKPVVVAPHHLTLGGGCEMVLHCDRAAGAAETYIGLVEVGVGLIPGGGGTKEMAVRAAEIAESTPGADHFELLKHNFELTAMGKVATSAVEAKNWGLMRRQDRVVMNDKRVIEEAKRTVLRLATEGYVPPQPRQDVLVLGEAALTKFKLGIHMMKRGGYISDHDALIGLKIATVMSGGNLTRPTQVSEQYLLDLEREAFVSLCGTKATQERIAHMLKTGKPLRN